MPMTRPPYSSGFREQMVELVRSGRSPEELAREFEDHPVRPPDLSDFRCDTFEYCRLQYAGSPGACSSVSSAPALAIG